MIAHRSMLDFGTAATWIFDLESGNET